MHDEGKGLFEFLEKVVSTGFEVQEKVVDSLSELVTKGKISEEDRKKFMEDLDSKLCETRDKGEEFIEAVTQRISDNNPIATRGGVDALEEKLEKLEKKVKQQAKQISALEGKKTTAKQATTKTATEKKTS